MHLKGLGLNLGNFHNSLHPEKIGQQPNLGVKVFNRLVEFDPKPMVGECGTIPVVMMEACLICPQNV